MNRNYSLKTAMVTYGNRQAPLPIPQNEAWDSERIFNNSISFDFNNIVQMN